MAAPIPAAMCNAHYKAARGLGPAPQKLWRALPRVSKFVERSAKLFDEGASRSRVGKAPAIIGFAVLQNCTSMSRLNASRFVELYNLAVQRNIQSGSRDRDLNEIRVCSLVGYYFGTDDPVLRGRFHVTVPHTWIWCRQCVEGEAARKVINTGGEKRLHQRLGRITRLYSGRAD